MEIKKKNVEGGGGMFITPLAIKTHPLKKLFLVHPNKLFVKNN